MRVSINTEIAFTYLLSRRKQTAIAALGVTFGIGMFIFMNSLITGTNEYFEKMTLSAIPHIRLYNENDMCTSEMLDRYSDAQTINLIGNPQIVSKDNRIYNPNSIVHELKQFSQVMAVSPQVNTNVIYSNGNVQSNGNVSGVNILEQDKMFDISSTLVTGSVKDLSISVDGIIIGIGLSKNLNVRKGDNITLTVSNGAARTLRIVGIFETTIKNIDRARTYASPSVVQQLLKKDRNYITEIFVNVKDHTRSTEVASTIQNMTGYSVETWQSANQQSLAARRIRDVIANSIVVTILIVAGFGIYNILNMAIYEKIKEIAILKAMGFAGVHVISIFIRQALFIGILGGMAGLLFGWGLSYTISKYYIGLGNVDFLPITFYLRHYLQGFAFGITTAFFAGYIPAIKASKVDPVSIIRG